MPSAAQPAPFQPEAAFSAFLTEAEALFDMPTPRVLERWQGVYAKGPTEFLIERGDEGALVLVATTGIGMTTGLGLAEENLTAAFGWARVKSSQYKRQSALAQKALDKGKVIVRKLR